MTRLVFTSYRRRPGSNLRVTFHAIEMPAPDLPRAARHRGQGRLRELARTSMCRTRSPKRAAPRSGGRTRSAWRDGHQIVWRPLQPSLQIHRAASNMKYPPCTVKSESTTRVSDRRAGAFQNAALRRTANTPSKGRHEAHALMAQGSQSPRFEDSLSLLNPRRCRCSAPPRRSEIYRGHSFLARNSLIGHHCDVRKAAPGTCRLSRRSTILRVRCGSLLVFITMVSMPERLAPPEKALVISGKKRNLPMSGNDQPTIELRPTTRLRAAVFGR